MADNFLPGDNTTALTPSVMQTPLNPDGTGSEVTPDDEAGAKSRFQSEFGQSDTSGAALKAYQTARASGQGHEQAYQTAVKGQGWGQQPTNAQGAPTTPVTATGGIPPPAATPQAVDARPDARTAAPVAAAPTYQAQTFQNTLTPTDISQFQAPDQSQVNNQQTTLLNAIMAHPETLDGNTIAQMKEAQKEQALLLGQQNAGAYAQGAVNRGTLGSGATDAFRQNNDTNINNAILSGNRSTDLAAVAQNRQDQLNALTASTGVAQDQLGRATSSYSTGLQGQLAGDSSKLSHAQFGLGVDQANAQQQQLQYASQKDANDAAYARSMGMAQNAQSTYGQDLAAQLGNQSQNLDLAKFLEQQNEFQQTLANNKDQFGNTLGFNYDQLGQQGNLSQSNSLLQAILGGK